MQRLINILFGVALVILYILVIDLQAARADGDKAKTELRRAAIQLPHGSGIVARARSGRYVAISNAHVCVWENEPVGIRTALGLRRVKILAIAPQVDLCALEAPEGIRGVEIAIRNPEEGDKLYTRGYPQGDLHESSGRVLSIELCPTFISIHLYRL